MEKLLTAKFAKKAAKGKESVRFLCGLRGGSQRTQRLRAFLRTEEKFLTAEAAENFRGER
jgi:hypothetical protein